jgi:hypothetical protein
MKKRIIQQTVRFTSEGRSAMKSFFSVLAGIILTMAFSCGNDTPTGTGSPATKQSLAGTWLLNSGYSSISTTFRITGRQDTSVARDTSVAFTGENDSIVFDTAMTYSLTTDEQYLRNVGLRTQRGTWSVSGGILTMVSNNLQTTTIFSATINGSAASFVTYQADTVGRSDSLRMIISTMAIVSATKK